MLIYSPVISLTKFEWHKTVEVASKTLEIEDCPNLKAAYVDFYLANLVIIT